MAMIAFFASSDEKIATVKNDAYLCLGIYGQVIRVTSLNFFAIPKIGKISIKSNLGSRQNIIYQFELFFFLMRRYKNRQVAGYTPFLYLA